jgi:hypothetical protein
MFYHPYDNKSTIIIKQCLFWACLLSMFVIFIFIFIDDVKIPQREITMKVDIKDKVNICLPEDEKIFKKSFFSF